MNNDNRPLLEFSPEAAKPAAAAAIIIALSLILAAFFQPVRIEGESMAPTYRHGDVAIALLRGKGISQGSPVIAENEGRLMIKRAEGGVREDGQVFLRSDRNNWDEPGTHYDSHRFGTVDQSRVTGIIIGSSGILRWIFGGGDRQDGTR